MHSNDLTILTWNVRGLNDAAHRELVREVITCSKPNIVCLQETKISTFNRSLAYETLGQCLDSFLELGAQGTRGGILLAWNSDTISVSNATHKTFSITATFSSVTSSSQFMLTTCYGPTDDGRKEDFLAELQSIKPQAPRP